MKISKKLCRLLSLLLTVCMIISVCPVINAFAAISYVNNYTGNSEISKSIGDSTTYSQTWNVAGFAGKAASDVVNTYYATDAGSGHGFLSLSPSVSADATTDAYDADSQVIEFNFLLEDNTSSFCFSPAFYNTTGYEYFRTNNKLVTTSGKGYFKSINSFLKFSANGIYITDESTSDRYVASTHHKKYLGVDADGNTITTSTAGTYPLTVGEWHTVAIRTPGLVGGVGAPTYDDAGNVVEGVYEGGKECYIAVDGVEYVVPMAREIFGTRHIKMYTSNTTHIDNLKNYFTKDLEDPDDYKNSTILASLTSSSADAVIAGKTITLKEDFTPSSLKDCLSGADAVRIYTDNTYTTLVDNSATLRTGNTIVAAAKNGYDVERSYNYYTIQEFVYEEPGILDGDDDTLTHGSGVKADGKSAGPCTVENNIAGKFGKDSSDLIYKITPVGEKFNTGFNFYSGQSGLTTTVTEISLAYEEAMTFSLQAQFYKNESKDKYNNYPYFLQISNGEIKTGSGSNAGVTHLASASRSKILGTINPGEWVNIAIVVPGYATTGSAGKIVYVYVNGVKNEITLAYDIYGTSHLRFAPTVKKSFYYDNVRNYTIASGEEYDESKDAQPVVDFGKLKVNNKTVYIEDNITVGELKENITTSAAIRVFEDGTYAKQLEDTDTLPIGAKVVFAAKNKRANERTYSYYTTAEMVYEEPDLCEGTEDLSLSAGTDNTTPATLTKNVDGVFGKAADDKVYRLDVAGATSTGYNFISSKSKSLDTVAFEFSAALADETGSLVIESSHYTDAAKSATAKGTIFRIDGGKVSTGGSSAVLATADRNKVLYNGKPGEWINIALVVPGYNQTNAGTDKIYIYVNGVEHEIKTKVALFGTSYMRLSPSTKTTYYYDNVRTYTSATEDYAPKKDAKPIVDFSATDMFGGNINIATGTTVAAFKELVSTDATIRVFADDKYAQELLDTDEMSAGNMVVFATKNKRTTERSYSYFTVNRPLNVSAITITNEDGKIIRGTTSDIKRFGETYYLDTTVVNNAVLAHSSLKAIIASYTAGGKMVYYDEKPIDIAPGTTVISATENPVAFEDVEIPEGGTLKAYLWVESNNEPLCGEFEAIFDGTEEYNILSIGNSYSNNSHIYLPAIAAADGVIIRTVNLYEGSCSIEKHHGFMTGTTSGGYDHVYRHTTDGSKSLGSDVPFETAINTPGYSWDYITLHQRGQFSPFYSTFYKEATPYLTEIAAYITQKFPNSEFLMFENWAPYTDRVEEMWDVYQPLCDGLEREQYIPTIFAAIKNSYLQAAEQIGNPNRVIPAGEAIYKAIQDHNFTEYVDNSSTTDTSFTDAEGAIYLDTSSHLTTYGKVLSALTWYEYLTGHDVTQNTYQNSKVSAEDMALLKQIAHEACRMEEYNPIN